MKKLRSLNVKTGVIAFILTFVLLIALQCQVKKFPTSKKESPVPINKEASILSMELPIAHVDIVDYKIDRLKKEISFDLDVVWSDTQSDLRFLTIVSSSIGVFEERIMTSITDSTNQLLYEIIFDWDTTTNTFRTTERTQTDEMIIQYSIESDTVKESYTINGINKELTYPSVDEEEMKMAFDFYKKIKQEGFAKNIPNDTAGKRISVQLVRAIADFDEFYSSSQNNTLHNNRDGKLLAYLLIYENFAQWMEDEFLPEGNIKLMKTQDLVETICAITGVCAGIKCWFGGLGNPVCLVCSAVATGCAINVLINMIFD